MTFAQNPELFIVIFIVTIEIALINNNTKGPYHEHPSLWKQF